jgi:uncharacterized protein with HEPN domain
MKDNRKDNSIYLVHILESISKIEKYTSGLSFDDFCVEKVVQDAVMRNIEIIGDAVTHISEAVRDKYSDVPWQEMKDTRNKLIHDYFGLELRLVWDVVENDIPNLKPSIERILKELEKDKESVR